MRTGTFRTRLGLGLLLLLAGAPASAALTVVNTNHSGPGSLRQAILDANANPSTPDAVVFQIPASDPGFDGTAFTIRPLSPLPAVRRATTIDGSTQTAFTGDTNPGGPEVFLDGTLLSEGSGLQLADDNVVTGLVISGFPGHGIDMNWRIDPDFRPSNNRVAGNYIGTDPTGTVAVPNRTGAGVFIQGVGSPFAQGTGNVIEDNLISGNLRFGIALCDADRTVIRGNRIGVDRNGAPLGNGEHGILLTCAGSPRSFIEGNTIAWSGQDGINDAPDYRFGVAFTADGHQGNRITGNSIHSNGGLGINLLPPPFPPTEPLATPTPNDSCDADNGGNLLQNFPEITRAESNGASTLLEGFLHAAPGQTYTVELFASAAADPSGHGEGETFLAAVTVTTDGSCHGDFSVTLPAPVPAGAAITATATDAAGNTSELSPALAVLDVNDPPVADAGDDQQAAAGAGCMAEVTLDGTGSSDPDGDTLSYVWSGPFGTASGASPTVTLPLGTHTVTLTVDDGNGGTDTDEVVVEVLDLAPPVISEAEATPGVLWPPNHKMRPVTVSVSAADVCDAAPPVCHLAAVASNEPVNGLGDGDTAPDWQITGDLTANLRSERSGTGSGRIYALSVICKDAAGNAAQGSATVNIPHSEPQ
jgi:parallel beta-helix repeat protein